MNINISFISENIFHIFGIGITNALLTALIAFAIIIVGTLLLRASLNSYKPTTGELVVEMVYNSLNQLAEDVLGKVNARKYFGFLLTFFVFILVSNWLELVPLVPGVGILKTDNAATANFTQAKNPLCILSLNCYLTPSGIVEAKAADFTPIFRAPTADLSSGVTFALISVVVTNLIGLWYHKFGYLSKYLNFTSPLNFIIGIVESISELGRILSFSFRLFGNIFAGEVLLAVITALSLGLATILPYGLELVVGLIQPIVFFLLTTVFLSMAIDHH